MAAADIAKFGFGYVVGGTGTDDTEVVDSKITVKAMAFSGNATTATCAVTSKNTSGTYASAIKFKCYDAGGGSLNAAGNKIFFGDDGVQFDGLKVNLSHASDQLFIYVK